MSEDTGTPAQSTNAAIIETTSAEPAASAQEKGFLDPKAFAAQLEKAASGDEGGDNQSADPAPSDEPPVDDQQTSTPHDDDMDDDAMPEHGAVPKSRFQKAIDKKNEYKTQAQKEREDRLVLQKQYDSLQEALKQTFGEPQKTDTKPSNLDPIDPETTNALMKEINDLKAKMESAEKESNIKLAQTTFADTLSNQQKQFEEKTPDFKDSWNHLLKQVYDEKIEVGFDPTTAERETMIYLQQQAAMAVKTGKNAAEVLYKMSKVRGYTGQKNDARKIGPDINKIAKNMQKSSSINDLSPATSAANSGYSAEMIPQLAKKPGGFIDPAAFKKLLGSVNRPNQ